ncbi:MAG: sulfite exporter TauE/SafE family protein [Cyclobacteriaceae bacterium]
MTLILIILLLILGLATGFYSGLIGTGGNLILIPALDLLFAHYQIAGVEAVKFIIAHSLFITIFLGVSISIKQHRIGNFYLKEVILIGLPGMISAYLMSELINAFDWYNKFYFDIIFLMMIVLLAFRLLVVKSKEDQITQVTPHQTTLSFASLTGLGFLTGIVTALSGLGGGIVLIPFLTDINKTPIRKASAISIGVITMLAAAVSMSYLFVEENADYSGRLPAQVGYISLYMVLPILVGIFLASSFGVRVAHRTSPQRLRVIFGIIVTMLCLKMAYSLLSPAF